MDARDFISLERLMWLLLVPFAVVIVWIIAYVISVHQPYEFRGEGQELSRRGAALLATLISLIVAVAVGYVVSLDLA